jgi:hypothetical protein
MSNDNEKYLDPLVYRTFPGTTIKGALPRRLNPNYRKYPSRIKRLYNWLFRVKEPPRYCKYEDCDKDIQYRSKWILIPPDGNVYHYCSRKCLHDEWFGSHDRQDKKTRKEKPPHSATKVMKIGGGNGSAIGILAIGLAILTVIMTIIGLLQSMK